MRLYTDAPAVRSFPALLGYGAALSTVMSAYEYTGGSLFGYNKDKNVDEYERRTQLRKNFQSPAEQTIAELGEGRGTLTLPMAESEDANRDLQVFTVRTTRSAVGSGSRRHMALRFPHPRSLHHKPFLSPVLILPLTPRARCVNYPPLSCCLSSMPETSIRISFSLFERDQLNAQCRLIGAVLDSLSGPPE